MWNDTTPLKAEYAKNGEGRWDRGITEPDFSQYDIVWFSGQFRLAESGLNPYWFIKSISADAQLVGYKRRKN